MMTQQEFEVLVQIIARAPVTQAEAMWINELIERIRVQLAVQAKREEKGK